MVVVELDLDLAGDDDVELLLALVEVEAALDAGRENDRVDAELGHAEAGADLAEAGLGAERVDRSDRVALAVDDAFVHASILFRLHRVPTRGLTRQAP